MWSQPEAIMPEDAIGEELELAGEIVWRIGCGEEETKERWWVVENTDMNLVALDWVDELHLMDIPVNEPCDQPSSA